MARRTVQAAPTTEQTNELMQEELYWQALTLFNNGDYEAALGTLKKDRACLSSAKGKQLAEQCEKLITEQYCYLINEASRQEDYRNARLLKKRYELRYGSNPRIEDIEVPEPAQSADNQQSGGESTVSSNRL